MRNAARSGSAQHRREAGYDEGRGRADEGAGKEVAKDGVFITVNGERVEKYSSQERECVKPTEEEKTGKTGRQNAGGQRCFNCREEGHQKRRCPKIECFGCKQMGHMKGDCPGDDDEDQSQPQAQLQPPRTRGPTQQQQQQGWQTQGWPVNSQTYGYPMYGYQAPMQMGGTRR